MMKEATSAMGSLKGLQRIVFLAFGFSWYVTLHEKTENL